MRIFDTDRINEIWETIARNRRRSIMTGMGVFWGIFMFTIMMGFGMWLGRMSKAALGDYSINSVYLFADATSIPYEGMPSGRSWSLSTTDVDLIESKVAGVRNVAAINYGGNQKVSYNDKKGEYFLMGYTPAFHKINPQKMKFGRFINDVDIENKRKVCVIGTKVWKDLFPGGESPEGKVIKMNNLYLNVVGVAMRGSNAISLGASPETSVAVPNSLVQQLWNEGTSVDMLVVEADKNVKIKDVEDKCKRVIAANHIISPDDTKAIMGVNIAEQIDKMNGLFRGISLLTWVVGLGTLLAGIVGVSNIMLVIVRERTQEIGVRRAIGAKPWSIISQILSESFVLAFIAGIFGLASGVGILSLIEPLIAVGIGESMQSMQITLGLGVVATLIIITGSIMAGIIPAARAMRIKPVDAIREE